MLLNRILNVVFSIKQVGIKLEHFSYIFQEKFENEPAHDYLEKNATEKVDDLLDYCANNMAMSEEDSLSEIPDKNSPFFDKLVYGLRKADSHFESNVFRKVMNGETEIVQKAYSTLPTVHITGNSKTNHEYAF